MEDFWIYCQLKTILPVTTTQYNIFDWPCYCLIVDDMEKELKHNIYSQLSKFYLTLFSVLEHKFLLVNLVADISMFLYLQFLLQLLRQVIQLTQIDDLVLFLGILNIWSHKIQSFHSHALGAPYIMKLRHDKVVQFTATKTHGWKECQKKCTFFQQFQQHSEYMYNLIKWIHKCYVFPYI